MDASYFNIHVNEEKGTFYITQSKRKCPGSALSTLNNIEKVVDKIQKGCWHYSSKQDDNYSKMSEEELLSNFKIKSEEIKEKYINKASKLNLVQKLLFSDSKKIEALCTRIQNSITPLDMMPIPNDNIQYITSFLSNSELNVLVNINRKKQSRIADMFIERARKSGYVGTSEKDAGKYLNDLYKEMQEAHNQGILPSEFITYKPTTSSSQGKKIDAEAFINNLDNMSIEKMINFFHKNDKIYSKDFQKFQNVLLKRIDDFLSQPNSDKSVINRTTNGFTALSVAAGYGNKNAVELLLKHGADVNFQGGPGNNISVLARAIHTNNIEMVRLLLDRGANTVYGNTHTLHEAIKSGKTEIAKALLEKVVGIDAADTNGKTALYYAIKYNKIEIVTMLLEKGAAVDNLPDAIPNRHPLFISVVMRYQINRLLDKHQTNGEKKFFNIIRNEQNNAFYFTESSTKSGSALDTLEEIENAIEKIKQGSWKYSSNRIDSYSKLSESKLLETLVSKSKEIRISYFDKAAKSNRLQKLFFNSQKKIEAVYARIPNMAPSIHAKPIANKDGISSNQKSADQANPESQRYSILLDSYLTTACKFGYSGKSRAEAYKYVQNLLKEMVKASTQGSLPQYVIQYQSKGSIFGLDTVDSQRTLEQLLELTPKELLKLFNDNKMFSTELSTLQHALLNQINNSIDKLDPSDINAINQFGYTILDRAASHGNKEVVERFLKFGATTKDCALRWAAKGGHLDTVKLLLENGANINAVNEINYKSALSWATENKNVEMIKFLFEKGAHYKDVYALHWVISAGEAEVAEALLEKAGIDAVDDKGNTALYYAIKNGDMKSVELLLEHKADTSKFSLGNEQMSRSPLEWANYYNHHEIAKKLIQHGA